MMDVGVMVLSVYSRKTIILAKCKQNSAGTVELPKTKSEPI